MLEFYYGTVNSAKTLTMLAKAHAWKSTGKKVCIVKPAMDTRSAGVSSRVGLSCDADIILKASESLCDYAETFNASIIFISVTTRRLDFPSSISLIVLRLKSASKAKESWLI